MTARTDRSDPDRYSPAYATGRELGKNAAWQRLRRFGRATGARARSASSDCIVRTVSFGSDPLKTHAGTVFTVLISFRVIENGARRLTVWARQKW